MRMEQIKYVKRRAGIQLFYILLPPFHSPPLCLSIYRGQLLKHVCIQKEEKEIN